MRIVVGGETRKAGKTTVVCRIVSAFPEAEWTVVKITPHAHGGAEASWTLEEDSSAGDTRRYRDAGARRTMLYCGDVQRGLGRLIAELGKAGNWIVETTSAAGLIAHDLAILVTSAAGAEVKEAAGRFPGDCVRLGAGDEALESVVRRRWKQ